MSSAASAAGRMAWIDVTRGFAVFLVVFYHSVIALAVIDAATPVWAGTLNNALSPFRIPLLMFCSGLLLPRSLGKPVGQYVVGKLRHIGWPYVVWTFVIVVFLVGGSNVAGQGNYGPSRILSIVTAPGTYTWYLAYLLLFYLIALIVPARYRTLSIPVLLAVSAIVADGDGWTRTTFLLAFFFLGDTVARHRPVWDSIVRRRWVIALAGLAALATAVVGTRLFLRYEIWAAIGVLGVAVLAEPVGGRVARTALGRRIASIGRDSIVYYTTHWIVVAAGVHVLGKAHVVQGTVDLVLLVAAGVAVPFAMVRLRRRFAVVAALYTWPGLRRRSPPGRSAAPADGPSVAGPAVRSRPN